MTTPQHKAIILIVTTKTVSIALSSPYLFIPLVRQPILPWTDHRSPVDNPQFTGSGQPTLHRQRTHRRSLREVVIVWTAEVFAYGTIKRGVDEMGSLIRTRSRKFSSMADLEIFFGSFRMAYSLTRQETVVATVVHPDFVSCSFSLLQNLLVVSERIPEKSVSTSNKKVSYSSASKYVS